MQSMKIENKHWGTKGNRSAGSQWAQGMISAGASAGANASAGNGGRGQSHSHTPAVVTLEFGVQTHVASTVITHQLYVF